MSNIDTQYSVYKHRRTHCDLYNKITLYIFLETK